MKSLFVGYAKNLRSWLLTDAIPWPRKGREAHLVPKLQLYSGLLEYLGCEAAQDWRPELFTSEQDEQACDSLLDLHARDVSLALDPVGGSSILNILPARVLALISDSPAHVLVRLAIGDSVILAAITHRSAAALKLGPGREVFAQIKSVALL